MVERLETGWDDLIEQFRLSRFRLKDFGPVTVAIDAHGDSMYQTLRDQAVSRMPAFSGKRKPRDKTPVGHRRRPQKGYEENMARYLEDFEIGETWIGDPIEVTESDITTFARQYDPQPMHTDPEKAAQSRFGGVIASGWHVVALTMRAFIQGGGHRGTPAVGLGVDELRWRKPVRPADVLSVTREVVGVDRSRSRPEFGTVRTRVTVTNQNGDVVLTMVSLGQVPSRPAAD